MRIISFNANGIRSAADKGFFRWFAKQNADVLCLQETKAQEDQLTGKTFHPRGYHRVLRVAILGAGHENRSFEVAGDGLRFACCSAAEFWAWTAPARSRSRKPRAVVVRARAASRALVRARVDSRRPRRVWALRSRSRSCWTRAGQGVVAVTRAVELAGAVELDLQVVPRASQESLGPVHGERLKLHVSAPPVDGAANDELIRFLARELNLPQRQVTLVRGEGAKIKLIEVVGRSEEEVRKRFFG